MTTTDEITTTLTATLRGIRPIMFDRYPGDNKTKLDPLDKFYLNEAGQCCVPMLAIFSLLSAQNTPSVAKRFWGKQGRDVATGIMAFINVEAQGDDPLNAVVTDGSNPFTPSDSRIKVLSHVGRTKQGTPNPTTRPIIPPPWFVTLRITHTENEFVSVPTLKKMVEQGGTLGLGTFRPIFGRYVVEWH